MNRTLRVEEYEKTEILRNIQTLTKFATPKDLENKIFNQNLFDCFDYLPDNFVDLLVVDPPYNLTKNYAGNKFAKTSSHEYEKWFESWILAIKRCLKKDASIYVCSDWQSSNAIQNVLEKHFYIRNRITWEREKGRGALSNWKNCSEDIWFCTVSNDYFFNVDAVKLKRKVIAPYRDEQGMPKDWEETADGNYRLTFPSNLWTDITLPFWSMPENTSHPTQKPEKLIAKLILASSQEGDFIFDPFVGSGTSCVVAKKLNRKYCGIEKELEYSEYAIKRLAAAGRDNSIQGYKDGFFWERNSLSEQKKPKSKLVHQNLEFPYE
jgi:site-specific DNA-methyltransferase (adenine-specific)